MEDKQLKLFIYTVNEYQRFYRQLPKSKITDSYDESTYVKVNTKLMLLRKYGNEYENVYIKNIIEYAIEKYPNKEMELRKILEKYLMIEEQLELILADGTRLNLYKTIEDVMYGMYLHADENRINHLMNSDETLRFACVRRYVEQLEEAVLGVYDILKSCNEIYDVARVIDRATVIFLGDRNNKQGIKKSSYWSNLYGTDGTIDDIGDIINDMNSDDVNIINVCYNFIGELQKENVSEEFLDALIYSTTKKDWGDYSEAKVFYNSIEKPGLSLKVRYNENHTMAYVRILPNVENIFLIQDTHVINQVYEISLVKEDENWKVYSVGGHLDSYILK